MRLRFKSFYEEQNNILYFSKVEKSKPQQRLKTLSYLPKIKFTLSSWKRFELYMSCSDQNSSDGSWNDKTRIEPQLGLLVLRYIYKGKYHCFRKKMYDFRHSRTNQKDHLLWTKIFC